MKKILILLILFFSFSITFAQNPTEDAINKNTLLLTENSDILELFGPVLPIAFSPFFGVALTSAASILASEGIIENEFLATHPLLSNYGFLIIFLILTILTAIPKYTKVTGQFGLFIGKIEDYAGVIILILIQILPPLLGDFQTKEEVVVYQAGFFEFTYSSLITIAAVVNLYVIRVVRFFFDFLIFLSPIPAIDAIFDNSKKVFIAFVLGLYAINPLIAFIVNVVIFLISLIVFRWVHRRVIYFENIYINPIRAKIFKKYPDLVPDRLPKKIKNQHLSFNFTIKVFTMSRINKFKRKMLCWLICENGKLYLYKNRIFRKPLTLEMFKIPEQLEIGKDLFWFRIQEKVERLNLKLNISNEYKKYYDEIINFANLTDIKYVGAKSIMLKAKKEIKDKSVLLYQKIFQKKLKHKQKLITG